MAGNRSQPGTRYDFRYRPKEGPRYLALRLEKCVKLTNRELDLVKNIDHLQRRKIRGLVGVVVVLLAYWLLRYAGILAAIDIPFDSLLIFYVAFLVGSGFGNLRTEDRHVELLRRYVNNDADTLAALSERGQSR